MEREIGDASPIRIIRSQLLGIIISGGDSIYLSKGDQSGSCMYNESMEYPPEADPPLLTKRPSGLKRGGGGEFRASRAPPGLVADIGWCVPLQQPKKT